MVVTVSTMDGGADPNAMGGDVCNQWKICHQWKMKSYDVEI